jgi:Ran GTPase-activating protein (RanGAP) involved in mRNA processing and transport
MLDIKQHADLVIALQHQQSVNWRQYPGFTRKHMQAIANELPMNKTVTALDISYNAIADGGAILLYEALKKNTTLRTLNLDGMDCICF